MNGVDIPHYCWHPKLSIDGSCRLCQVEIEGVPKLQIACNTPVTDGMVIHTQSERVEKAREGVMELLLVNHPLDCPICDQAGECKLQDYAFEYGQQHARTEEPRRALKKRVDLGPTIVFDQERCILCRRCVRFCREVPGTGELAVFTRGDHSVIETFPDQPLSNDYSMNVADICPVGALTTKDFRFKIRVWFLEDVPGVCTGCSNGCNVHLGVANNRVYRYVPRRNDAVNQTWICDEGRLSYKRINADDRLDAPAVRGADGALMPAVLDDGDRRRRRAHPPRDRRQGRRRRRRASPRRTRPTRISSSRAASSRRSARRRPASRSCAAAATRSSSRPRRPPTRRARVRSASTTPRACWRAHAAARSRRWSCWGTTCSRRRTRKRRSRRSAASTRSSCSTRTTRTLERVAHVVLPARVAAEKHGTLTNHAGRVQRVQPAVEPAFEARAEGEVLWLLGRRLGLAGFEEEWDARAVAKQMADVVPALAETGA